MQCQRCRSYQTSADGGNRRKNKHCPEMQSTDLPIDAPVGTQVVAENIVFKDEVLSDVHDQTVQPHGFYDADEDTTASLGSFLSRPVRIANVTWNEGATTSTVLAPWQLFFNDTNIKNKLQNYSRIACRLHLKFVVNASPFYYGCMRACYFPIPDERSDYVNVVDQIPFSQTPGVFIEPQKMTSAELVLPFFWQDNWLDLTSSAMMAAMGKLQMMPYASLRSANGVVSAAITIGIYAWAEDVVLMGPTTVAAMQSDEYSLDGVVSAPATAIANVASRVTDVPVIGPFARATEVGARAIAGVAKIFGYSNPPNIENVAAYQPRAFHALANVDQSVALDKLSLDPKNEVAMGQQTVGIPEGDPLSFEATCGHDSFLFGTNWSTSDSNDALLASAVVAPAYRVSGGGYYVYPPLTYFSMPYRYWRGSIIYTFKFVKSKYHKGRVIISYDPAGVITSTTDTETTTFTRIVDISVEDEVEIEIPYKATSPWLQVPAASTALWSNGSSPSYTYSAPYHNGTWSLRVQNILTGPAANPEIDVLVFVRAGKDFTLSCPVSNQISGVHLHGPTADIQSEDITMSSGDINNQLAALTVGETIASHRPLIHRTVTNLVTLLSKDGDQAAGAFIATLALPRNPLWSGRNPWGSFQGSINSLVQVIHVGQTHPVSWFSACFVGRRGSMNIQINPIANKNATLIESARIDRRGNASISYGGGVPTNLNVNNIDTTSNSNATENAYSFLFYQNPGVNGGALTNTRTQAAISVNAPQYLPFKFARAWEGTQFNDSRGNATYDELTATFTYVLNNAKGTTANISPMVEVLYSAGVDYQVFQFLCTPRLFSYTITPV